MFNKKWIIFILILTECIFCSAQQKNTTSYRNDEFNKLNIVLNGKVKNVMQISYSPNNRCDTIPSFIDDAYYKNIPSGVPIPLKCTCDTIIYHFDNNLFPQMIKYINYHIDESNIRTHKETIYLFENGNLISEISSRNGKVMDDVIYKYDSRNNLILKKEYLSGVVVIDSLEYDNNNNLLKKFSYRSTPEKSYFKKTKRQNAFKKNKKSIFGKTLYASEEFQYNASGNLISKTWNYNRRKDIYIYDTLGNKIEEGYCENYKGDKCKYKPILGFVYDENNRLIKSFTIGDWKPHNTTIYYNYDEQGKKIEVKGYYIYNKQDTTVGYHRIYEYDEHGQEIKEESLVGRSYKFINFIIDYKTLITTYDNYKNIIRQEFYTADNQITYIVSYAYTYDSLGNWIKQEEYTGKNKDELVKTNIKERKLEYY